MSIRQLELQGLQPHHDDLYFKDTTDLPFCIPRYKYRSIEQFWEISQIEYTRYEKLNRASIHRYHDGQKQRYSNYIHHDIYPQYRERLQALEHRFGYSSFCLPQKWSIFPDNTHHLLFFSSNPAPYFIFFIDETVFSEEFISMKSRARFRSFRHNTLLAMAPLPERGLAVGIISSEFRDRILEMNLKSQVQCLLGSGVSAIDDESELKFHDTSFGPKDPGFPISRPTLVIEVGTTQTLPSLDQDARWWLNPTKGGASVCINCKLDCIPRLVIDVWERCILGQGGDGESTRVQHIIITRNKNSEIVVSGAPLIVKFNLLMGRLPLPGLAREGNLEIGAERLREIAIEIWKVQGLLEDEE